MTYHCWCWPWSPGPSSVCPFPLKLLFFSPFLNCTLWKEITMYSPQLSSRKPSCISLRVEYLQKLFGILLQVRFVYSLPVIYLFNHLFILVWTHEYLLYIWCYNTILLNFVAQFVPALAAESSFSWGLCYSDIPPSLWDDGWIDRIWNYKIFQECLLYFLPWVKILNGSLVGEKASICGICCLLLLLSQ